MRQVERVNTAAERIEKLTEKADKVGERLDSAITEAETVLEMADGAATSLLQASSKLRGFLGTNAPPPDSPEEGGTK